MGFNALQIPLSEQELAAYAGARIPLLLPSGLMEIVLSSIEA